MRAVSRLAELEIVCQFDVTSVLLANLTQFHVPQKRLIGRSVVRKNDHAVSGTETRNIG